MLRFFGTNQGIVIMALCAAALVIGCTARSHAPSAGAIDLTELSRADAAADRSPRRGAVRRAVEVRAPVDDVAHVIVDARPAHAAAGAGLASPAPHAAPLDLARIEPGDRVVVDSLVGQINGRPIFADAFFDPIEAQLRAIRQGTTSRDQFYQQAGEVIAIHLRQIVRDELFLAQSLAQLKPEQRQGLFAWMRHEREQAIARGGGTIIGADERWREREGMSLDEYLQFRRDAMLVWQLFKQRIEPRVIVTWRDIQRAYIDRHREFNPPMKLKVARIALHSQREAEAIENVMQRLAAGDSFQAIARELGQHATEPWQEFDIGPGGVDALEISDTLKRQLKGLQPGETSEPFPVGASTWWLHAVAVERPPARSLYEPDVQRRLYHDIHARRMEEEQQRYIATLFDETIYDELIAMHERLLNIAMLRYAR
jgi:hypothetical protein